MAGPDPVREDIRGKLHDAINDLRSQLSRVQIWADALDGFSRPVPDYRPDSKFLLAGKSRREH